MADECGIEYMVGEDVPYENMTMGLYLLVMFCHLCGVIIRPFLIYVALYLACMIDISPNTLTINVVTFTAAATLLTVYHLRRITDNLNALKDMVRARKHNSVFTDDSQ